jgi:hypothetical protein
VLVDFAHLIRVASILVFLTFSICYSVSSGRLSDSENSFTIYKDADSRLPALIETKRELIKSRSYHNNSRLVLFPEEVVWASVDSLYFPWHLSRVKEFTRLPDPSS